MRKRMFPLWGGIVCALLLVGISLAQGAPRIDWSYLGGGGQDVRVENLALNSSIGQSAAGVVRGDQVELQSGYQPGTAATATPGGPTPTASPTSPPTSTPVAVVKLPLVIKSLSIHTLADGLQESN